MFVKNPDLFSPVPFLRELGLFFALQEISLFLGIVQIFSELEFVCTLASRVGLINPVPRDRIFGSTP